MVKKQDERFVLHFDVKICPKLPSDHSVGWQFQTSLRIEMEYRSFIFFFFFIIHLTVKWFPTDFEFFFSFFKKNNAGNIVQRASLCLYSYKMEALSVLSRPD